MNEPFIQAVDLTKRFQKGKQQIIPIQNLSFQIESGEFISLMGPSGSGKTTLLNLIAGIDSPTSGTLNVGSQSLHQMSRDELTKWRSLQVGYVFQLYHLMPVLTAYENVELPLLLHNYNKRERREKVQSALEQVGLSDRQEHFPKELSGGQEQRVAIARALVAEPLLIVADEPTGDLDRDSADEILDLLEKLSAEENKTIVMVTHDPKAAQRAKGVWSLKRASWFQTQKF